MNFRNRCYLEEAMDDPERTVGELSRVFDDLNRTNQLLGGQYITLRAVKKLLARFPGRLYRIVDMGCGDGDLLRRLAVQCRRDGIEAVFLGIDGSPKALEIATQRSADFPEIRYEQASLPDLGGREFPCEILLCTLTLHHFNETEAPLVLDRFRRMASLGIIINDLQRNRIAYYLFQVFSRIFIKTKIAKEDGLISIRRGFSKKELLELSLGIPNFHHRIRWRWVFRYLWVMQAKANPLHE